jgi:hypothetical protein
MHRLICELKCFEVCFDLLKIVVPSVGFKRSTKFEYYNEEVFTYYFHEVCLCHLDNVCTPRGPLAECGPIKDFLYLVREILNFKRQSWLWHFFSKSEHNIYRNQNF